MAVFPEESTPNAAGYEPLIPAFWCCMNPGHTENWGEIIIIRIKQQQCTSSTILSYVCHKNYVLFMIHLICSCCGMFLKGIKSISPAAAEALQFSDGNLQNHSFLPCPMPDLGPLKTRKPKVRRQLFKFQRYKLIIDVINCTWQHNGNFRFIGTKNFILHLQDVHTYIII